MSFNFKNLSTPLLDAKVSKAVGTWTPRVYEPSDSKLNLETNRTERTNFLTTRTQERTTFQLQSMKEPEMTQRTRLPALGPSVQSLATPESSRAARHGGSVSKAQSASQMIGNTPLENLLRALGGPMPKSLLNSYHGDLLEGLVHYTTQKHFLDLNHRVVSSNLPTPLPTNAAFAVRDKLRELVLKVESEHFPRIVQDAMTNEENIDGLLRDYTQTVVGLTAYAKGAGLTYIAEALEALWKFLVVALDKLFGIRQKQTRMKFLNQIDSLKNKIEFLDRDLKEAEEKIARMKIYYDDKIGLLLRKNREITDAFNSVKDEFERWKSSSASDLEGTESLVSKFTKIQSQMNSMDAQISLIYEENVEQNKLVRSDLLKSIMGLFNKGFRSLARNASTQTDLSLCHNSLSVYKYGIVEHVLPEEKILAAYRHPFLSFLYRDNDGMTTKPRSEELIDFLEGCVDSSRFCCYD